MVKTLRVIALMFSALLLIDGASETRGDDWETWSVQTVAERFRKTTRLFNGPLPEGGEDPVAMRLGLSDTPCLQWTNPSAGNVHGLDYLMIHQGVPIAYCSVYQWFSPLTDATADFTSLSEKPVTLVKGDRPIWQATRPGVNFVSFGPAVEENTSAASRLTMLRRYARQFSASIIRDNRSSGDDGSKELRLLDRPLYRFEKPLLPIVDGALFAFVEGTDPEVLLIVQMRKTEQGRLQPEYGLARANNSELVARLDDQVVWTVPADPTPWTDRTQPYFLLSLNDLKPSQAEWQSAE